MGTEYDVPTTEALDAMYESLKNWGRWGADDQRGALNHLTHHPNEAGYRYKRWQLTRATKHGDTP